MSLYLSLYLDSEKAMATHSSTLAWKIPWMEEPGRLQSMGSQGVGRDWATSLSFFTFMHWRREWQPIPVFLAGESQGQQSRVGCRLWGRTELDTMEATQQQQQQQLHTLIRMAKMQHTDKTKYWWGSGAAGTLIYCFGNAKWLNVFLPY